MHFITKMNLNNSTDGSLVYPLPSEKKTPRISELPQDVSHKICTGLVIFDLVGACRELIDNALDANATNIGYILVNLTLLFFMLLFWFRSRF